MTYDGELRSAAAAARRAGAVLLEHFARPAGGVRLKGGDARELVTDADDAADRVLREQLRAAHPGDGVLTEETPEAGAGTARRWVVDPLDGTTNFVAGLPFWAVSIALEADGACVLATVYDPLRDELFQSAAGEQATCNGEPLSVAEPEGLDACVAAVLLHPRDAARPEVVARLGELRAVRELGATALELAWVAAGRLDLCVFRRTAKVWDWLAGARLVQDAGGAVCPWGDAIPRATVAAAASIARASQPAGPQ